MEGLAVLNVELRMPLFVAPVEAQETIKSFNTPALACQ